MNAYELSNEALLKEFMTACARAGTSNSGLCYDPMAGINLSQAHYLRGVALARIEGKNPPFKPEDKILCTKPDGAYPTSGYHFSPMRGWTEPQKVARVYYKGNGIWELELTGHSKFYYSKDFTLAPPTDNSPPPETNDAA